MIIHLQLSIFLLDSVIFTLILNKKISLLIIFVFCINSLLFFIISPFSYYFIYLKYIQLGLVLGDYE